MKTVIVKPLSFMSLLFLVFISSASYAEIRRVPQQYNSIQSAIDSSIAGDTVLIDTGMYSENLIVNKSISIIGTNI